MSEYRKCTADELFNIIDSLDNKKKKEVLDCLYDRYYEGGGGVRWEPPKEEEAE